MVIETASLWQATGTKQWRISRNVPLVALWACLSQQVKRFFVFWMILGLSIPVFTDNRPKISATKINVFRPVVVPTQMKQGFCWVNSCSLIRSDAWRCMVSNQIFDPCFALKTPGLLVCEADPTKNESGFFLRLTEPLPTLPKMKAPLVNAWIIELEDGQICNLYTGTMPIVEYKGEDLAVRYGCQNIDATEWSGLLSDSIVSDRVWRAKKVTYISTGLETKVIKVQNVKIKEVWQ